MKATLWLLLALLLAGCPGPTPEPPASPVDPKALLQQADRDVFRVVSGQAPGQERRRLLEEARGAAGRARPAAPGPAAVVEGQVSYLEGDPAGAEAKWQEALRSGLGDPFRESDLEAALAWLAFRRGDTATSAERHLRAMARLRDVPLVPEAWNPRWEFLRFDLAVLDGRPVPDLAEREDLYRRLRRARVPEDPEFRASRETLARVDRLRRAGKPFEAVQVLEDQLDLEGSVEGTRDEPGTERVRSFFSELQEEKDGVLYRVLLGDLLREDGAPEEALPWYRQALERLPGHPVLLQRLDSVKR